jgi:hypothetical protein
MWVTVTGVMVGLALATFLIRTTPDWDMTALQNRLRRVAAERARRHRGQ